MGKINLAILDNDARYMDNLASYITGHYRHRFHLMTFTNADALINHMRQKDAAADILLISAMQFGEWVIKLEPGLVILLSSAAQSAGSAPECGCNDAAANSNRSISSYESVDKYCGADKLVADILKIYAGYDHQACYSEAVHGGRDNRIVSIISADGGCGRTSIAIALCAHLAKLRLKTLFISLDLLGAEEFAFEGDKNGGLSEIIYTMKARPDKLGLKLEALEKSHPGNGFYYFSPPLYPMDIDEIQPSDIETLIARLRGTGIYDRIIFDSHCGLSLRNRVLMNLADSVLIVARGGRGSLLKLQLLKSQIDRSFGENADDLYRRCHIIINHAETLDLSGIDSITSLFSARVTVLPYCADMRDEYNPETLANVSRGFGATLAEVARRT